jgi:hypothetical protein
MHGSCRGHVEKHERDMDVGGKSAPRQPLAEFSAKLLYWRSCQWLCRTLKDACSRVAFKILVFTLTSYRCRRQLILHLPREMPCYDATMIPLHCRPLHSEFSLVNLYRLDAWSLVHGGFGPLRRTVHPTSRSLMTLLRAIYQSLNSFFFSCGEADKLTYR